MSEISNSTNGNSWTLLTSEVKASGVENIDPVGEGHKNMVQLSSSGAHSELEKLCPEASAHQSETEPSPQLQSEPALTHQSEDTSEALEPSQVTSLGQSEGRAQLNAAHASEEPTAVSGTVEDVGSWTPDHEEQALTTQHVSLGTDADSFSDSYSHLSATSGSSPLPASVCQESLRKSVSEESKEVLETNGKEADGLRKRNISHLGILDKTEAEDDEEEEEEEIFQPPHREEDPVFSLNKCILAAVILLGLGTIFFSEADMDNRELKDPTNQEWQNPDISRDTPVGLQPPFILSKHANEHQQILALQTQLQQHQGEVKAAQLLAEERDQERVRREALEMEFQRIKSELDRVPALHKELEKENERVKEENVKAKKELEALPSLQRELEHLRAKVSQLTQSTGGADPARPFAASQAPSSGDRRHVPPLEKLDTKHRKTSDKKIHEKEQGKGDKEWKKKDGKKRDDKERKERVNEEEHKDRKTHKNNREEGRREERKKDRKREMGKEGKEKRYLKESEERKEDERWEKDKKWKKDKHVGHEERRGDEKDWKDAGNKKAKEEKEWKQRGERKEDKHWKSDKQSGRSSHKEQKEKRKDERKDQKEWKKEKSEGDKKKWKEERAFPKESTLAEERHKRWKEREVKDEDQTREEKQRKAFNKKEKQNKEKYGHMDEHEDHEDYWSRQRARIQHYDGQQETCGGVEDCARVQGLSPVSLRDFENLLQSYLNKLQDPEEQASRKEELRKLVKEFFPNGVFAHDQMPFSEFVDDVGDILEDMAEGEESDSEGEESDEDDDDDDEEMEDFEREALEKFALQEKAKKGDQKKESGRVKD